MEEEATSQSSFVEEKKHFNDSELYKMMLYTASPDNRNEAWEISIKDGWVNGICRNKDRGEFWRFLIENGLAERVEIIRC